jgi:hypothetical protein
MADTREVFLLRLPPPLKDAVREKALANKRSLTKEIEAALENHVALQPVEAARG